MEIEWRTLHEFDNYLVSNYGEVINKYTGRSLKLSRTPDGTIKVGLFKDRRQYTRSIKVLVAETFVPGWNHIFDTPIQLDGTPDNTRADNLAWRPRWFALKYSKQFERVTSNDHLGPLIEVTTGTHYIDVYEAAVMNGLLFTDIRRSAVTGDTTFPTFFVFEWK